MYPPWGLLFFRYGSHLTPSSIVPLECIAHYGGLLPDSAFNPGIVFSEGRTRLVWIGCCISEIKYDAVTHLFARLIFLWSRNFHKIIWIMLDTLKKTWPQNFVVLHYFYISIILKGNNNKNYGTTISNFSKQTCWLTNIMLIKKPNKPSDDPSIESSRRFHAYW